MTDIARNAIGVTGSDGVHRRLLADDRDSVWPDGWMYAAVNMLNRCAVSNAGKDVSDPPYCIVRFKALTSSVLADV